MRIEKIDYNKEVEAFVDKEFAHFEQQHEVSYDYHSFCFAAKEQNEIIGIVAGHTCFSEVYISDLAIKEQYRGKHIGTQLMKKVEEEYRGKGFQNINLTTYAFQAPLFYEKMGYECAFVIENKKNPKMNKYYFVKYFDVV